MGVLIRCESGARVVLLESIERKGGTYCEMWASLGGFLPRLVAWEEREARDNCPFGRKIQEIRT